MSKFITQVDFSTQIKEYQNTEGTLSGSVNINQYTILGTDYSDLQLGLDVTSTGITSTITPVSNGYFTGTTGSTTFYFSDSNMDIAIPYLSAITSSNSGTTQYVDAFQPTTSIVVDGNNFDVYFSGVSFNMTPINFYEYISGEYSGETFTSTLLYVSGTTYPWWFLKSGSTIWNEVKGRTKTDRLTITESASTGYVLTCLDSDGNAAWQPSAGGISFTGNTSASCITDLYVKNLYGCSPILLHDIISGNTTNNYIDLSSVSNNITLLTRYSGNDNFLSLGSTYGGARLQQSTSDYLSIVGGQAWLRATNNLLLSCNQKSVLMSTLYGLTFVVSDNAGGGSSLFQVQSNDSSGSPTNNSLTGGTLQGEIILGKPNSNIGLSLGVMGTGLGSGTNAYGIAGSEYYPVFISTPRSRAYDTITYSSIKNVLFGGGSDNIVYTGVTDSSIIGGTGNTINSYIKRSVVLGGENMTATTSNTVYVPDLVIKKSAAVPTTSGDTIGEVGSVTWDNSYFYVKTNLGWGRISLDYVF